MCAFRKGRKQGGMNSHLLHLDCPLDMEKHIQTLICCEQWKVKAIVELCELL